MRHTEDNINRQETDVFVSISRLYKQRQPVFQPYSQQKHLRSQTDDALQLFPVKQTVDSTSYRRDVSPNSIISHSAAPATHSGRVIVPRQCRTQRADGEFVLMGRIRLKRAYLSCALRTDDFHRVWTDALRAGSNRCDL